MSILKKFNEVAKSLDLNFYQKSYIKDFIKLKLIDMSKKYQLEARLNLTSVSKTEKNLLIEWAKSEIKEWQNFIKQVKKICPKN